MKKIYLVRHGETDANINKTKQPPHQPLNDTGLHQAARVAERTTGIDFDVLIASDYLRAQQTAKAIAVANKMSIETSELFREAKGPTQFFDRPHDDPDFEAYMKQQKEHRNDPDWHFADEENPLDLLKRAKDALQFLVEREEESIMVVSHGLFLRTLTMQVLLSDKMNPDLWYGGAGFSMKMTNTGINVFTYDSGNWSLFTWNDHAHFAE